MWFVRAQLKNSGLTGTIDTNGTEGTLGYLIAFWSVRVKFRILIMVAKHVFDVFDSDFAIRFLCPRNEETARVLFDFRV